jgi:prevent-host-death family protein
LQEGNALIEVSLPEAGERLEQLIEEATAGEDVVITTQGGAAVRLVALPRDHSTDVTRSSQPIGHSLDWLIGTWSEEEEREFLQAIEVFEQVDESFWK